MIRKLLLPVALLGLMLGGCASLNTLSSEVSTFGSWPADRKPASFVFDRLPSQDAAAVAGAAHTDLLENAARGALEARGFRAVGDPQQADYLVQVGARVSTSDPWIVNGALFGRGPGWGPGWGRPGWGYGPYGRYGGWYGPGWGAAGWGWGGRPFGPYDDARFDREVVLLIRDRRSNTVLYEARADTNGYSPEIDALLPAMFTAAMQDFPRIDPKPRTVQTPIGRS